MADDDMTASLAEGEMCIGEFKTKGFRLYSLALLALAGVIIAIILKVDPAYIAILATIAANLVGVFTGKKA
jgi:hypothetical protein